MGQDISGASLFERFLVEAKDVAPSRLTSLPILQAIHAAPPATQIDVIESCARFFSNGAAPKTVVGKYAEHALRALLHPMLSDTRIPWTLDRARQLLTAAQAIPRAGLVRVFQHLGETGGWTEELRSVVFEHDALTSLRSAAFDPMPRPGESWSDRAREDLAGSEREVWIPVLDFIARHLPAMTPSTSWEKQASELRASVGESAFRTKVTGWLAQVAPTTRLSASAAEHNASVLHGFVAMLDERSLSVEETEALAHVVRVAFSATDFGAYLPKLGYRALKKLRFHPDIVRSLERLSSKR